MAESDAGVFTYAYQERAAFVTLCTLVIVKIRMTLGVCGKSEKVYQDGEITRPYQGSTSVSTGKLEVALDQATTCWGVRKALITEL